MNTELIEMLDTVSILDENDILSGAIVWEIAPFTITFLWQGAEYTQARAWAEIHTELQAKFNRAAVIDEILGRIA